MSNVENEQVEYQVRKVERYIVTRFESSESTREDGKKQYSGGSESFGEFVNEMAAYKVGYALCKAEHLGKGWPFGDGRIKYPEHPDSITPAKLDNDRPSVVPAP
jgi:hypothetical protein